MLPEAVLPEAVLPEAVLPEGGCVARGCVNRDYVTKGCVVGGCVSIEKLILVFICYSHVRAFLISGQLVQRCLNRRSLNVWNYRYVFPNAIS